MVPILLEHKAFFQNDNHKMQSYSSVNNIKSKLKKKPYWSAPVYGIKLSYWEYKYSVH